MNETVSDMLALCLRSVRTAAFWGVAAILLLIIPLPSLCAAGETPRPVQRKTLPSGLRVIVAEQPQSALVALDLRVRVGSGRETAATNGTAHFIEHLVFKGTETRKRGEIDQAMENMGGELKAQTTRDATRFATVLPAAKWQDALGIIAEMALHPAFRAEDVTAEKKVILSERAIARTEPTRAGFNTLTETVFDATDPYRLPLMGAEANIKAMTPDALRHFWQAWYRPENMVLAVAGNVTAAEVFALAEKLFPAAPTAGVAFTEPEKPATSDAALIATRSVITDTGVVDLATVFIGFRAPSVGDADSTAAVAGLVSLLADRADLGRGQGRLADALIRKQHLAISVTADYVAQTGQSLVMIAAVGKRTDAEKLEKALGDELRKLPGTGFSAADAAQARQNLRIAGQSDGTVEGMASRLAGAEILGLPDADIDDPSLYAARLERSVTPASLTAAARRYLSLDNSSVVVISPPAPVEQPVEP